MFRHSFLFNPKRGEEISRRAGVRRALISPFVQFALWCGFTHIDYGYVHGDKRRIRLGRNCSTMNTLFNVISGTISIGDDTLFAHNCMVLTGIHQFVNGRRASLLSPPQVETPTTGRDIVIGSGCFIGSGAIILGNVTIGDNVIIAAGAVVASNMPDNCIAAGIPARVMRFHDGTLPAAVQDARA